MTEKTDMIRIERRKTLARHLSTRSMLATSTDWSTCSNRMR